MGIKSQPSVRSAFRQSGRSSLILLKALPGMFTRASSEWINDNAARLSASLAFYTLLSLGPIIVLVVAFADVFSGQHICGPVSRYNDALCFHLRNCSGCYV